VSAPADVWLLARVLAWSFVLPVAKRMLPLPRLVRLMWSRPRSSQGDRFREDTITALVTWVFKTRPPGSRDNCLERSLVAYRYLSRAGLAPSLVIGIEKAPSVTHGHVWVTVEGRPVHDSPEVLARFEPVAAFGSDGMLTNS
jgi:hypothetical protein